MSLREQTGLSYPSFSLYGRLAPYWHLGHNRGKRTLMHECDKGAELLLCDVGNTNIKFGLANREKLLQSFNLPCSLMETEDSLGLKILLILGHANVSVESIKACVISSVVPGMDPILRGALKRYLASPLYFVPQDLPVPLQNRYPRHQETGADRLVGAYAARSYFPKLASFVLVDFGTAVTFDCVEGNAYMGGLIFPGPGIAVQALAQKTAKLPVINFDFDSTEPQACVDTATSIQHGIIFGYQALVEGLCARLVKNLPRPLKIIATGTFALTLDKISNIFDAVLPFLMLDGLRDLYYTQVSPASRVKF